MDFPANPVVAVTHADPYPYYRMLAAERPFAFHSEVNAWVAAGASAVNAVLANPECHVRPRAELVPKAFVGTPVGRIFQELARVTEGKRHESGRSAVLQRVSGWSEGHIAHAAEEVWSSISGVSEVMWRFPAWVLARLMGFEVRDLMTIAEQVEAFAMGISPGADLHIYLDKGNVAAERLWERFSSLGTPFEIANAIGILSQSFEATGGWIGNTLVALSGHQVPAAEIRGAVVRVSKVDPAVHNTRRFVNAETVIQGVHLKAGDVIILILASTTEQLFGEGGHQCVAERLAGSIVSEGVRRLNGTVTVARPIRYRASLNIRIPLL